MSKMFSYYKENKQDTTIQSWSSYTTSPARGTAECLGYAEWVVEDSVFQEAPTTIYKLK